MWAPQPALRLGLQELLVSPHLLVQHSIPVVRVVQYPGEFIINYPGGCLCRTASRWSLRQQSLCRCVINKLGPGTTPHPVEVVI